MASSDRLGGSLIELKLVLRDRTSRLVQGSRLYRPALIIYTPLDNLVRSRRSTSVLLPFPARCCNHFPVTQLGDRREGAGREEQDARI
jgi:hypothetical protein